MDLKKIEKSFEQIIGAIGEENSREGLRETPKRISESYNEIFSGVTKNPEEVIKKTYTVEHNDMIIEKNVEFYSMCEHHFLPFFGTVDIAYIPDGKVVGFSDIIKIIEILSKRPQIQERFGRLLAETIYKVLNCQGVMIVVKAKHLCMVMRGEKKSNSEIITTVYKGVFETDKEKRGEVLNLLK